MAQVVDVGALLPERISVELGSLGQVLLLSLKGEERLSTLFRFEGHARVPVSAARGGSGAVVPERVAGDRTTLTLRDLWGSERTVQGLVSEAEVSVHEVGEATVRFVVRPELYRLTLGSTCRAFHDLDVIGIAKKVFQSAGLPARFEIRGDYRVRPYTVQYNESDFTFVTRLLEEEGIFFWFDHAAASILVVGDHSPALPDLDDAAWRSGAPQGARIAYRPETGLESAYAFLREIGPRPRATPGKFSLGSFDYKRPSFKIAAQEPANDAMPIEYYDAPGAGDDDPAVLAQRAKVAAERARVLAANFEGSTPSVRLAPGRVFDLAGHPFARVDGRYVVVGTSFAIDNVGGLGTGKPIDVSFHALPVDLPFRPELVVPPAKTPGLQTGAVVGPAGQEIHTDSDGRVRLQQHWDREGKRDESSGRWVRVAQRGVAGSMMFPRMGWNILSLAEEGSADVPVALSRTFDAEHPPPYALPENKTRVAYRTATSPGGGSFNEIRFEDKKGAEEMFINSTGDMNVLVKNNKEEVVHGYMVHKIGVDHSLTVGGTYDVHIEKDQTVSVGANQSEKVGADRQKLIDGSESITIGASRNLKTGVNIETAGKERSLKVGAVHMSATLGEVKAQAMMINQLVGGAVVKATPRKMTEVVGSTVDANTALGFLPAKAAAAAGKLTSLPGVSGQLSKLSAKAGVAIQTVGALKFEHGLSRKVEVKETYSERVLGAMQLVTEAFSDTAKALLDIVTTTLDAKAKQSIVIKSDTEVVLKCGGSSITLNDKGIKIVSPEIQLDGASGFAVKKTKVEMNGGG